VLDDAGADPNTVANPPQRVALVTGGSRGIGTAIVKGLVERGVHVACGYRLSRTRAEKLRVQTPEQILPVHHDLASEESCATAIGQIIAQWGRIDTLIVNAGTWTGGKLAEMDPATWWDVVELNLRGAATTVRLALPHLSIASNPSIVLVSSAVALIGFPGDTAYASAKSAMIGFGRSLAKEVARDGVRVNVLAPGFVDTDMTAHVPDVARKRIERDSLLGRFGSVEEIARAAVFLSEDATYSTGSILVVDGGWTL
jgi:3-oxoacyl-[acyl-carrier protein] reductase